MGVIRYACIADDVPLPSVDFLCTLVLARRAYRLPCYRLPFVAAQCYVELGQHDRATDDACGTALIARHGKEARRRDAAEAESYG